MFTLQQPRDYDCVCSTGKFAMAGLFKNTLVVCMLFTAPVSGQPLGVVLDISDVPDRKQTGTAYYLSNVAAYDLVKSNPSVFFVDVRSVKEIARTGHPAMIDAVVPVMVEGEEFDEDLQEYKLVSSPKFVERMLAAMESVDRGPHDMIIVTCGSGVRSAMASRALEDAGFTNVWHIPEGYDGDTKPGLNTQNSWKNADLPWTETFTATVF
jgi:rhodanese-related sulfurtransferase